MHEGQLTVDRLAANGYIPRHGRARHAYANGNGLANGNAVANESGDRVVNDDGGDIAMSRYDLGFRRSGGGENAYYTIAYSTSIPSLRLCLNNTLTL